MAAAALLQHGIMSGAAMFIAALLAVPVLLASVHGFFFLTDARGFWPVVSIMLALAGFTSLNFDAIAGKFVKENDTPRARRAWSQESVVAQPARPLRAPRRLRRRRVPLAQRAHAGVHRRL